MSTTRAHGLASPRLQRRLLWLSAAVLVAGVAAVVAVFAFRNTAAVGNTPSPASALAPTPKPAPAVPKNAKLPPAAQRVAGRFILTAVARKNLREAWALSGPGIRQGQTLAQWLKGNIAVVPFPIDKLDLAPMKIDLLQPRLVQVEVALVPKPGTKIKPQAFFMDLVKVGAKGHERWVVNAWVPRGSPLIPVTPGN